MQTSPPAPPPPTTANLNSTHSNIVGNTTTSTTTEPTPAAIAPSENYSYVTLTAVSETLVFLVLFLVNFFFCFF